jgi:hypothetical protein
MDFFVDVASKVFAKDRAGFLLRAKPPCNKS